MLLYLYSLWVKAGEGRRWIAPKLGSIRVATGVVDGVDRIQDDPVGGVGMTLNRHDDAVVSQLQKFGFLVRRAPCSQRLRAARNGQARLVKQSIEGKSRSSRDLCVQTKLATSAEMIER